MSFFHDLTIAIPVFERLEYFEDAINSALNQTLKCNVIVVDNCSSHHLFEDYVYKLGLSYVKYYRNETNLFGVGNWNKCIDYSSTPWVTVLHSDDMLSTYFVENIVQLMSTYPNEVCYLTNHERSEQPVKILEANNAELKSKLQRVLPLRFLFGNITSFPGVVFNKKRIPEDFRFNKTLRTAADLDFWYRLSKIKPILFTYKILAFYRVSPNQDSANEVKDIIEEHYAYRRDTIKFRNKLFKLFSMYELYQLYNMYLKSFKRKSLENFDFKYQDINRYFLLFNNAVYRTTTDLLFRVFKKSIRSTSKYVF